MLSNLVQASELSLRPWSVALLLSVMLTMCSEGIEANERSTRTDEFRVDEATWTHVDVAPDGKELVFGLLGDLYTVSIIDGGKARRLFENDSWAMAPSYSPDGNYIAYLSESELSFGYQLWLVKADGTSARRIGATWSGSPTWSTDSAFIISNDAFGQIRFTPVDGGEGFTLGEATSGAKEVEIPKSGDRIYFSNGQIFSIKHDGKSLVQHTFSLTPKSRPRLSPDGTYLGFYDHVGGDALLTLRNLTSGQERVIARVPDDNAAGGQLATVMGAYPAFRFSSDGRTIFVAFDGAIREIDILNREQREIPFQAQIKLTIHTQPVPSTSLSNRFEQVAVVRSPTFSRDGDSVIVSALGSIWRQSLSSAVKTPATPINLLSRTDGRLYDPVLSPDGGRLAVVRTLGNRYSTQIILADIDGTNVEILTETPGYYANPTWSADGSKLAYLKGRGAAIRGEDPSIDQLMGIYWTDIRTGRTQLVARYKAPFVTPMYALSRLFFDASDTRIYFNAGKPYETTELWLAELDGSGSRAILRLPMFVGQIVPSPSGRKAAIATRQGVWLTNLPSYAVDTIDLSLSSPKVPVQKISDIGFGHIQWHGETILSGMSGTRVFRWAEQQGRAEKIASIRIDVPSHRSARTVALNDAQIVAGSDSESFRGVLAFSGGTIRSVSENALKTADPNTLLVDMTGLTIIPGLVDAHFHGHHFRRRLYGEEIEAYISSLSYGVTTVFDPSALEETVMPRAEAAHSGLILGPRVTSTGQIVSGDHGKYGFLTIESTDDANIVVDRQKQLGAFSIKSYGVEGKHRRRMLLDAAADAGIAVTAEGGQWHAYNVTLALEGHNSIEHAYPSQRMYNDLVQALVRSDVSITSTLVVESSPTGYDYFFSVGGYELTNKDRRFLPYHPIFSRREWKFQKMPDRHFIRSASNLRRFARAGGKVSVGSHGDLPGIGLHFEMWLLSLAGFSNREVIEAATIAGALKLGLESEIGSLEEGKFADFLVLRCNPLENIRCTADIEYVVKGGVVWHADSMTQMWPEYKPLPKPWWHSDEDWEELKPELPEPWEGVPIAEGVVLEQVTVH